MGYLPAPRTLRHAGCAGAHLNRRPLMRVAIALGSNLDDRLALLRRGRDRLRQIHDQDAPFLCSKIYETSPLDCPPGSPPFLNAVIELSTSLPPFDLLALMQKWESDFGRPSSHAHHAPRTIDLDILYCGSLHISHSMLTLPHPRIFERLFVLDPLCDICPDRKATPKSHSFRELRDILRSSQNRNLSSFIYDF